MSELGVTLFKDLDKTDIQIVCCIDKKKRLDTMGIKTIIPSDLAMYHDEIDLIIVTPVQYWKEINKELKKYISSKTCVIGLDELLIRIVLEKY